MGKRVGFWKKDRAFKVLLSILIVLVAFVLWNTARFDLFRPNIVKVTISQSDYDYLLNQFSTFNSLNLESAYCLNGYVLGGVAHISSISMPFQERSEFGVLTSRCKSFNAIGLVHVQPSGYCDLSETDYYSLGAYNVRIFGIVCNPKNFSVFAYTDLYKPIKLSVV